jgi:alpha-galactosidase
MVFEGFSATANMTRLLSAVVTGTVFLDGDDLTESTGQGLAQHYLTNDAINAVARIGKAFRPVNGNSGDHAPDLLSMTNGSTTYLAVFNFGSGSETQTVDLGRVGLDSSRKYAVTDVWSGDISSAKGTLNVPLASQEGRLLALQ